MKNLEKIEEFKKILRDRKGLWECGESLDNGDFIGSIECFNTYLKKNSKNVEAHCGKALAIFDSGEPDLAIEALTEGLKLDPVHEYGLLIRAEILRDQGKLEFALKLYDKLLVKAPLDTNYQKHQAELQAEIEVSNGNGKAGPISKHETELMTRKTPVPAPAVSPPSDAVVEEPPKLAPELEPEPKIHEEPEISEIPETPEAPTPMKEEEEDIPPSRGTEVFEELDELEGLDLDEIDKLSSTVEEVDDLESIEDDMEELSDMVFESCGTILDSESDVCQQCGVEHDQAMYFRGIKVTKASEADKDTINNYEEDRWSSFVEKSRSNRNRTVSMVGIFCIISLAIYLIFMAGLAIYDSVFVEFDTLELIPNSLIFIMGFGALYGGISVAKNSIVFDHFLDSIFETEIYPRLEPALEEVAQVQARLDSIEDKMERMNMNISRSKQYPSASEFPAVAISNKITSFLKMVVVINITIGILMYTISNPGRFAPYLFTIMFMLWWAVITDDYKLWKNAVSWGWAIIPIFAIPFMSIFLYVLIPIGTLIGLIGGFLIIYAYSYYAWVRYYVEGKLPFGLHEAQLEEEDE